MPRMMEHTSGRMSTLPLPSDPGAPAAARNAVEDLGGELPPAMREKLSLVASELVTNAIRHAVVADPAPTLTLDVKPSRVTLAVQDRGTIFDLEGLLAEPGAAGGWGLRLVDSLVDRWHVERHDGTRVVCEIDRPS
jgi:anti-sigma regulatory factor (Ser/Thr protein kinase)